MGEGKIDLFIDRMGGNPFLISKAAQELLLFDLNAKPTTNLETTVPKTVAAIVERKLLRIQDDDADARIGLDYASILGGRFQIEDLAELIKTDPQRAKHLFEKLESTCGLVRAIGSGGICLNYKTHTYNARNGRACLNSNHSEMTNGSGLGYASIAKWHGMRLEFPWRQERSGELRTHSMMKSIC